MASGLITRFLGEGLAASRPADPDIGNAIGFFWSTDSDELSMWREGAWVEDVLAGGGIALNTLSDVDTTGVADGDVLTYDSGSGNWIADAASGSAGLSAQYDDQKAANTAGGSSTSGSWLTRDLNTEVYDEIGLSLASNQISLAAGTYEVEAWSQFFDCGAARIRIRDVTNNVTLALSINGHGDISQNASVITPLHSRFTLAGTATIELQYRVNTSTATNGLGIVANFGEVEIYSRVILRKLS